MFAASEVVLQRVHVWRQFRDLPEEDGQVETDSESDQVQTSDDSRDNESCEQKRVSACGILVEDVAPSFLVIGHGGPVLVCEPSSVDVEGNEATVHDHAKDVVASA